VFADGDLRGLARPFANIVGSGATDALRRRNWRVVERNLLVMSLLRRTSRLGGRTTRSLPGELLSPKPEIGGAGSS